LILSKRIKKILQQYTPEWLSKLDFRGLKKQSGEVKQKGIF